MHRRSFIQEVILSSGALFLGSKNFIRSITDESTIRILMIYNNRGSNKNFVNDWGLSMWIETKNSAVLYDTGGNSSILSGNIAGSEIDLRKLSEIVISHNHQDHTDGISMILEKTNYRPVIYVPENDLESFKAKNSQARYAGISDAKQITAYLFTTGQLKARLLDQVIYEQSVILSQRDTIVLLTGCSHPGIVEIVQKTKNILPGKRIALIAGGFHLLDNSEEQVREISAKLKNLKVEKIAPSHCTGEQAINILRDEWREGFIDFNIGNEMQI